MDPHRGSCTWSQQHRILATRVIRFAFLYTESSAGGSLPVSGPGRVSGRGGCPVVQWLQPEKLRSLQPEASQRLWEALPREGVTGGHGQVAVLCGTPSSPQAEMEQRPSSSRESHRPSPRAPQAALIFHRLLDSVHTVTGTHTGWPSLPLSHPQPTGALSYRGAGQCPRLHSPRAVSLCSGVPPTTREARAHPLGHGWP